MHSFAGLHSKLPDQPEAGLAIGRTTLSTTEADGARRKGIRECPAARHPASWCLRPLLGISDDIEETPVGLGTAVLLRERETPLLLTIELDGAVDVSAFGHSARDVRPLIVGGQS